jgi:hypothetical protein
LQGGFGHERSSGAQTTDAVADGKSVWFWHPLLMSNRRRFSLGPTGPCKTANSPMTVTKRNSSPGRARHKP